jgi:hypothetical protein
MTPEIIREARFSLHIYGERGAQHHLPHVHIRRRDGGAETVVSLPLLHVIVGPTPSRAEIEVLEASLSTLISEWGRLND